MYSGKRVRNRALIAAASSTALLVGGAFTPLATSAAGAVTSPGVTIETWPELNFVAASGYKPGTEVTVQVFRGATKIGQATQAVVLDAKSGTGIAEINHDGNPSPTGPSDCWDAPNTPDIQPGDEVVVTGTLDGGSTVARDSSVVRDVKLLNTSLANGELTFNGWVRSTPGAPVNIETDVLEVRVEPHGDRENLARADFNNPTDPTRYSHRSTADAGDPPITADQVEEVFLEWANAGGEGGEASEITVSTPDGDPVAEGCPALGDPPAPGPAALTANPNPVTFGDVVQGSSAQRTVTITNTGGVEATNLNTETVTGAGFSWVSDTCGATLAVRATCDVVVRVSVPASTTGSLDGRLSVTSTAPTLSVPLTANAVTKPPQAGEITVLKKQLQFGLVKVRRFTERSVTVRNEGPGTLTVSGVSVSSGKGFTLRSENCDTLAAGATCRIVVRFSATLPKGLKTGTLTIASNDASEPTSTVALLGRVRR